MAILVEFGIDTDRFRLGQLLGREGLEAELERIVPAEESVIPYVWVTGTESALADLTARFEASSAIEDVAILDKLTISDTDELQYLYRIEWDIEELDIMRGIIAANGTILEGTSANSHWILRFRFGDHEDVATFYQYLTDHGITEFTINSIYELETRAGRGGSDDLTPEQREALTLAAQRGYFELPRTVTLEEIGNELDITQQAVSDRIRRGIRRIVHSSLNLPENP